MEGMFIVELSHHNLVSSYDLPFRNKIITLSLACHTLDTRLLTSKSRLRVSSVASNTSTGIYRRISIDRKKVLKHHPDKKAGVAGDSNDDAFFKCIQKAMEVLTNPERRRQFDSVDPYYEDMEQDVPTEKHLKSVKNIDEYFFKTFGPIFEREARFSKIQPVPLLGALDDPKEAVESFYEFWYNFDSWRSFEYLDKEVNEGSDRYAVFSSNASFCSMLSIAVTISVTRKRRTSRNVPDARKKTLHGYALSST